MNAWLQARRDDLVWWWRFKDGKAATLVVGGIASVTLFALLFVVAGRVLRGLPI